MVLIIWHNAKITMYWMNNETQNGIDLLSLLMIHVIRYEKFLSHYKEHSKNVHISMKSYQGI